MGQKFITKKVGGMLETYSMIFRKLVTSFVASTVISILFALLISLESNGEVIYNKGTHFLGGLSFIFMYVGAIIFLYGNLVSIGLEYLYKKWFKRLQWLYILLHGVFGLANFLLFQEKTFAFYGMAAALFYACLDRWLFKRSEVYKSVKMFFLVPIGSILIIWGFLQLISPAMPPFTKEDAVEFATSGEGTVIEFFPERIGKWKGTIEGYQVERETSVKEIGDETYIVTFTEHWRNEKVNNTWSISYQVKRGSSSANGEEGIMPPYYK